MKINVDDKNKILAVWFCNSENPSGNLPQNIETQIQEYRDKKYKICMYQSGTDDIKNNLLNLILNNAV